MFRRRPGRRPPLGRRGAPLSRRSRFPLPPKVRRALIRANRLIVDGQKACLRRAHHPRRGRMARHAHSQVSLLWHGVESFLELDRIRRQNG